MIRLPTIAPLALLAALATAPIPASALDLTVHTDKVLNPINPFIYGHFFEHIYNGGDNGLWGEMVWNRSFEYLGDDAGKWSIDKEGVVTESAITEGAKLLLGKPEWADYDFTVQARKLRGAEGFLLIARAQGGHWLWANIAGWGNTGHQFQYVGAPGNRDFDRRIPGRIETDRWYTLRLRAEGRHLQAFLDGQQILETTLPEGLDPAGQVGVGTWNTAAEFKNFKVTDLQGKTLFEGTPPLTGETPGAGRHWQVFGAISGGAQVVDSGAFNDEHALRITSTRLSEEIGISQDHFALRQGEHYKGSLYLKGNAPHGGAVRFRSGNRTVVDLPLPPTTDQWKEYPIDFTSTVDAPDARLLLAFSSADPLDVLVDQVSLMSESSLKNDGFRPDIYAAFAALRPTIIRWPGGCYLEQYHWKNAIGPQSQRTKNITPMWNDYDPNALGTDEYMTLCRKLKAEPLLVINTGMHVTGTKNAAEWQPWIQEACDWVEYCNGPTTTKWGAERAKNGHPDPYHVKYWEIDNELWRSLQPNPAVYAQAVPLFAAAMKKIDPSITIIAHGGNGADRRYDRVLVNNAAPDFDILSIHHYMDPQRFASGIVEQDGLYKDLATLIQASKNPSIKLDVSEWNAQTTDWRTGLYAGGLLNTFEKNGANLAIAGPALLFRHVSAPAWDNAFINFDHKGWFPAPNYVVMKLWNEHFAPERLGIDGLPDAPPAPPAAGDALNLVATRTADASTVILKAVNPTGTEIPVAATFEGAFSPAAASFELIAPGDLRARNTMDHPDNVKPAAAAATLTNGRLQFTMPPYSAGVLTLTKRK
jgi:alpha-N-arabinofuranosidase